MLLPPPPLIFTTIASLSPISLISDEKWARKTRDKSIVFACYVCRPVNQQSLYYFSCLRASI